MRFCCIGAGRMGIRHLEAAKKLGFDIIGIADPSAAALQNVANEFGLADDALFTDSAVMLSNIMPEALVIASTAPYHCEIVNIAATHGVKYILCEKPMSQSIKQCQSMIEICRDNSVLLAINHQMMYMPQYQFVKRFVDTKEIGELRSITVAGSNFGLSMNGSHYFEMFRFLTGEELDTVSCWRDEILVKNPRGDQFSDISGQVRCFSSSNIRMTIELGGDLGHGMNLIFHFTFGQIFIDEFAGFIRVSKRKSEYLGMPTSRYGMPAEVSIHEFTPRDLVDLSVNVWTGILSGSFPNGSVGLHAVKALVAANISAENKSLPVKLSDSLLVDKIYPWA